MSASKRETEDGSENGLEWLDTKTEEELGALRSYTDSRFYSYDHAWKPETEEKTHYWLSWEPREEYSNQEEPPYEIQIARTLERNGFFQGWSPFEVTSGHEERFTLQRYFGSIPPHPDSDVPGTVVDLCSRLDLKMSDPDPVKVLPTLKVMRDIARERLGGHAEDLASEVMEPLRKVLIACAIEATKALTDSRPLQDVENDVRRDWSSTLHDLDHLWEHGIGGGISFDIVDEHENWYDETFQNVPEPVANGVKAALKAHVGRSDGKHRDMSRDGILDRARPVYLKWEAARRMIWSTMYDWTLEEAANRRVGPLPDIFKGTRTLRKHAADIVKKYESDAGSLPDGMEQFKENWAPGDGDVEGYSKAQMLVNAIGDAGLSDEYNNPDSFCSLVEQLLQRHDTG